MIMIIICWSLVTDLSDTRTDVSDMFYWGQGPECVGRFHEHDPAVLFTGRLGAWSDVNISQVSPRQNHPSVCHCNCSLSPVQTGLLYI